MFQLDSIIFDKDYSSEINAIDSKAFSRYKPNSFDGKDSAAIQCDKSFEHSCVLIAQNTSLDAKKMTVLQFYGTLETIREQNKDNKKKLKK